MTETTIQRFACQHSGCRATIALEQANPHAFGLEGGHLWHALELAASYLGWRRIVSTSITLCSKHAAGLLCSRCAMEACSCVGGPRFDVQPGGDE
jgi:hypothetical protein